MQRREKGKIEECKAQALCFNGEKQLTLGWRPSAAQWSCKNLKILPTSAILCCLICILWFICGFIASTAEKALLFPRLLLSLLHNFSQASSSVFVCHQLKGDKPHKLWSLKTGFNWTQGSNKNQGVQCCGGGGWCPPLWVVSALTVKPRSFKPGWDTPLGPTNSIILGI